MAGIVRCVLFGSGRTAAPATACMCAQGKAKLFSRQYVNVLINALLEGEKSEKTNCGNQWKSWKSLHKKSGGNEHVLRYCTEPEQ